MAHIEGQIELSLQTNGNQVTAVRLHSSRPVTACRVLIGQTVQEAPRIVSLLYSVCGHAQTLAALKACESAKGIEAPPRAAINRECMMLTETVREHAWRLLMDWPLLMEQKPAIETFQSIQRVLANLGRCLCPEGSCWRLGGEPTCPEPTEWLPLLDELERLLKQYMTGGETYPIRDWESSCRKSAIGWLLEIIETQKLQTLGASDVTPLPRLPLTELDARLAEDETGEFVARPRWQSHVHETGPVVRLASHPVIASLTQRYGRGLLVRVIARWLELLELPTRIGNRLAGGHSGVETLSPAPGIGLAEVETARGRLLHRVEFDGERVRRYQVLAPTEWNFHPDGPLVRGLHGLSAETPEALQRLASMTIVALDPCVGYHVIID